MKETRHPTFQDIEELTAYLPRLYADGFSPVIKWEGGERRKDGSYTVPYPSYHPLTEEFFRVVSGAWLDYEYNPDESARMLDDEQLVKTASLSQIRRMLTYCVRGERFSDGHWGVMIERGHIRRILERLNEIKSEMK